MTPSKTDLRLSVLDTVPIPEGSTARAALYNTVDLARSADASGYHRYWVPEHHSMRGVASSAPAVLVSRLADATDRIRVGSGGVLLPNHAPLVVAEQFGTLEAFYPGRIDLGIGRASGGPPHATPAIRGPGPYQGDFAEQLGELLSYFDEPDPGPRTVRAVPAIGNRPEPWLLGTTPFSARLAGEVGLPYAFAHHLNPDGIEALEIYRDSFQPSETTRVPKVIVSVSLITADTDANAEWLAGSIRLKVLSRMKGKRIRMPSPEDAASVHYTRDDRDAIGRATSELIVGAPATVRHKLEPLIAATATTELMVKTLAFDHADRRRSYELLAESSRQVSLVK
ncbi:LLM class flavin-dependent oxidoreductase [Saccharopolyspora endophytica]|uniref:LLM class flavin-dependent oxidoreductase n=1 Tax=Saccharopolyspora endophytica TaxID=543886 RepID=A0ABS5D9X3_9PSEU|nr:LLM class flavin-dependent oxidoreductase [Saccharopolyspora endophytica]MBQ0923091.1 LLM class flavin-dependent oxidoreductase [Saccharopolyspora endophytica]